MKSISEKLGGEMSLTEFEKSQLKTWCLDISLHLKGSKSSLDTLLERATKIHAFITDAQR